MPESGKAARLARAAAPARVFDGRAAVVLAARFAVACAALALVLLMLEPLVFGALGRLALDAIVLSASEPRVTGLEWVAPVFQISSPLHPGSLGITAPWFRVALVVPLALALALPGGRPRARLALCAALLAAILLASALALANDVLAALVGSLARKGITPFAPWRASLHTAGREAMWEFAMVYLPAAACLFACVPFARFPASGAAPGRSRPRRPALLPIALFAAVGVLATLDGIARARVARFDAEALLAELEAWNPELGAVLLRTAEAALAEGRTEEARRAFLLALRYERTAAAASDGLRRVRERVAAAERPP